MTLKTCNGSRLLWVTDKESLLLNQNLWSNFQLKVELQQNGTWKVKNLPTITNKELILPKFWHFYRKSFKIKLHWCHLVSCTSNLLWPRPILSRPYVRYCVVLPFVSLAAVDAFNSQLLDLISSLKSRQGALMWWWALISEFQLWAVFCYYSACHSSRSKHAQWVHWHAYWKRFRNWTSHNIVSHSICWYNVQLPKTYDQCQSRLCANKT